MGQPDTGRPAVDQPVAGQSVVSPVLAGQECGAPLAGQDLPPGQRVRVGWAPQHYGPVPRFRPETWDFRVSGATESGHEYRWDWAGIAGLPRCAITADLHCVTKCTIPGIAWDGIATAEVLLAAPPAESVTHVMVWADYGYSANIRISDFAADSTLFATGVAGVPLAPEHGYPMRLVVPHLYGWKSVKWVRAVEYLTEDRRGFWEERGYHNSADPWHEQRFSYQEQQAGGR